MSKKPHQRTTPEGIRMGKSSARLAQLGLEVLKGFGLEDVQAPTMRGDMCKSCACQIGTVPNGCLHTQLDLLKCAIDGKPFLCHATKDKTLCAGWVRMRAHLVATPPPQAIVDLIAKHELLPMDQPAIIEAQT